MITSIVIKNTATYNQTGANIENLEKLNYFFGNNGSGKSTVAKYLQSLADENEGSLFPLCSSSGYDKQQEEIIVFNQNFIDNNFKNSDTLKGVFSLNKTNNDIDTKIKINEDIIKTKTDEEKSLQVKSGELNNKKNDLQNNIIDECFAKRKIFKTFSKIKIEHSGNKRNNFSKIQNILKINKNLNCPKIEELNGLYKKLYEDDLKEITASINSARFEELIDSQNKLVAMLDEIIVGKEDVKLAELIQKYSLKSWVLEGKSYLEKTGKICPFCQQPIGDDFISQLNDMFDESYKQKVGKIESEKSVYERLFSEILENLQSVAEEYNDKNIVSNLQIQLKATFDENIKSIDAKIKAPNEKKIITPINSSVKEVIDKINSAIKQNNNIVNSIDEQKKNLMKNMWKYLAFECKNDIENYENNNKNLESEIEQNKLCIDALNQEISSLKQQNSELRTQTVNTKDAVDNINQILRNSGFMGFEIAEKSKENNISQYYLSRDGALPGENSIFDSLSEGEKNFISFLYFYQLCLGTTDILANSSKKKIIVIDDPVSSMDSQVLFIVSTLIHSLIRWQESNRNNFDNSIISQVFIFTHNLYFYKEIALKCRPVCKSKNHYEICKNEQNTTFIKEKGKDYIALDDYSLMWNTLKDLKSQIQNDDKSQNILIANLFRKILESYANFIGLGHDAWATVLKDDKTSVEYYLKCAFISIINDESHKVTPFDTFYFQKIHNETPSKLFDVFQSIFDVIGKEHYDKMMQ